ncbi:membrane integrity-associated transporter subunit PqiC [Alteromonas sp. 5E99-2]|uniref:PqiC family protein n=1 Tax=Alteromonas sp. 5E99-2 TaxID=2817683 RepID=UPI001A9949E0|nr:ABC-type transport auxiliary lipoprotein family protein [Alteromonas sp. 5E99-2]MBO1256177.1 membrane integrity-associated transporter subunit PqiC [Alteromonas sp. 5E99-2]
MRHFIFIAIILSLTGCSNHTSTIQHYLLSSPNDIQSVDLTQSKTLRLTRLTIPEYLKQNGLPLMLESNQIQLSKTHLWAESFDTSLTKYMQHAFSSEYVLATEGGFNDDQYSLSIDILHLVATSKGDVIISANYQINNGSRLLSRQAYSKSYSLSEDGYAHTINVYRRAINDMVNHIKTKLTAIEK